MCGKRDHKKRKQARGQSLVEFILVLPILLIIFLGLMELAVAMRAHLVLNNANREAARHASQGTATDEEVAERALVSFAEQLPVQVITDTNTSIIVSRYHVPAETELETAPKPSSIYRLGTLTYTMDSGQVAVRSSQIAIGEKQEGQERVGIEKLLADNRAFHTDHDIVVVETYYHHDPILRAAWVEWFPELWVLYVRTAMRVTPRQTTQ